MGTTSANVCCALQCAISGSSSSLRTVSILFSTRMTGQSSRFTSESAKSSSAALMAMRPVIFEPEVLAASGDFVSLSAGLARRWVTSTRNSTASRDSSASCTSCIMRRSSCVSGLCTPGVSTSTTCAAGWPGSPLAFFLSGSSSTPWMRVRVVCGLWVTMASFWPSRAFSSVDLPALGRPTMETNPERKGIS